MTKDQDELTKAMRWYVADRLAEDRLPEVNRKVADVHVAKNFYTEHGKRFFDICFSFIALLITAPINLIIACITLIDVGIPILFHQERLGRNGKIIHIAKFRNMKDTRDDRGELLPPYKRVTKFGKFVRKTSLDELLNFWNILKGEMSVIGPRPLVPEYYGRFNKRHKMRLAVRPGLECPPREKFGHVWTWQEQFENDIWYVEHLSFKTDCKMILNLIRFTFDRESAKVRSVSSRGSFFGYDEKGNAIGYKDVPQKYIDEALQKFSAETNS